MYVCNIAFMYAGFNNSLKLYRLIFKTVINSIYIKDKKLAIINNWFDL